MSAEMIGQWKRPDAALTTYRGNAQLLPNNNIFINWAEDMYISEFNGDGQCVMEARVPPNMLGSYRAYKFNFTSSPSEPPSLVAQVSVSSAVTAHTKYYISWNGATEVVSWNIYGSRNLSLGFFLLGTAERVGFETRYILPGYVFWSYAEGLAMSGEILGTSKIQETMFEPDGTNPFDLWSNTIPDLSEIITQGLSGSAEEDTVTPSTRAGSRSEWQTIETLVALLGVFSLSATVVVVTNRLRFHHSFAPWDYNPVQDSSGDA